MDSIQQTLRVTWLPSRTQTRDVQKFFDDRISRKHVPQTIELVGPIWNHPALDLKRTTVSFSSHKTAQEALDLEVRDRRLTAEQGGTEIIVLDHMFQGLTTLHSSDNPSTGKPDIDIVALHGLQGHAWNSFTTSSVVNQNFGHVKETNWLRDLLPRLLEQNQQKKIYPRVMTYGYNADVWMSKSGTEIDEPVDDLIIYLMPERRTDPERPLFFIGHSLGGIVIKQAIVSICNKAMIQSTQASSPRNPIYNFPVSGCMFFGVPDKGSDTVDTASKFLKLLATVFDVNRSTIEGLQVKSHKLADIAGQFRQIRHEHNIPVLSFYEKQEYSSTLGLIVNKDSAVIEYPGSPPAFGVDQNHKEMVKFPNADTRALEPAINFLTQIARNALAALHHPRITRPQPISLRPGHSNWNDKLSVLSNFDTVFLVDDSPSMQGERWRLVSKILDYSTSVATKYDPDGIGVHFFNNTTANQDHVRDPAVAVEIHRNLFLKGDTPIRDQLSRHLNSYLRKYHKRSEGDLDFKGYNLIILTDGEPNPEREDPSDISDPEDALVTKPAYRMIRKMIADIAHELDHEGAKRSQIGIQFCQIGNDVAAHTLFKYLDDRLKGKWKFKRDMIDTLSCRSEDDLTEKFFEKLLIGAIDKTVDYDEVEGSWISAAGINDQCQSPHPPSMDHLQRSMANANTANWSTDEKRDAYYYEHRYPQPDAYVTPSLTQRSPFSSTTDSRGEIAELCLPRSENHPQGLAELSNQQPARSKTVGSGNGMLLASIVIALWLSMLITAKAEP